MAGATSYTIQWSRAPGGTELQEQTTGVSQYKYIGQVGTYYARVVANNACGNTMSAEVSFTIASLVNPNAPRSPNPPAGTIIPRASLGYALGIIQQVARTYRGDLQNSCRDFGGNNIFMFRVVQALRQVDSRWGLNDKRGHGGDMSQDIIAFNPTDRPDNGEAQIYIYDVIAGHCTGNPDVWMNDVTDVTWAGGNSGMCGNRFCARWTIDNYLRAGFPGSEGTK